MYGCIYIYVYIYIYLVAINYDQFNSIQMYPYIFCLHCVALFLKELARLWKAKASKPAWQEIFTAFRCARPSVPTQGVKPLGAKGQANASKAAAASQESTQCETTPKKQKGWVEGADKEPRLATPEKVQKKKQKKQEKGKPETVQNCQPADFVPRREKEPLQLRKPRKVADDASKSAEVPEDEVGQADAAMTLVEGADGLERRIKRKTHNRCKKKNVSVSVVQLAALKKYIVSLGLTWPRFQSEHSRLGDICRQGTS